MKERFKRHAFTKTTLDVIEQAIKIIDEYESEGFSLTLRQLFYQFVARELLPNTQRSYKRLGGIVNDGRLAGLIDWESIEDRTRFVRRTSLWESPQQILLSAARSFMIDPWLKQRQMVEVWIEKDALVGVVESACNTWRIPLFSCRGYASQSSIYTAAIRHKEYFEHPEREVPLDALWVFHLGDHDPSGLDMTHDIENRLAMFYSEATIDRLALSREQISRYGLPPNPTKLTDSRCGPYIKEHGADSWELDAMPPGDLAKLVNEEIAKLIDPAIWEKSIGVEHEQQRRLHMIACNYKEKLS